MRGLFFRHRSGRHAQPRDPGQRPGPARLQAMATTAEATAAVRSAAPVATRFEPWPVNSTGPSWGSRVRPDRAGIGHQHLRRLLRVHEGLLRSGVAAAVTALTMREVAEAAAACRYFELDGLADLLMRVPDAASSARTAQVFDAIYRERASAGVGLSGAVRQKIACRPADFPLRPV